ncbi:hypothetical protein AB9F35_17980 [Rhizobium leguminosarum]
MAATSNPFQGDEMEYLVKRGKPIDSGRKKDLNKAGSIAAARAFSEQIEKGARLSNCPACGSGAHHKLLTIYGFDYHECDGRGSAFVCNPPPEEALSEAYQSNYYTEANKVLYANDSIIDCRVDQVFTPKVEIAIEHSRSSKKTWLDIGCGVGGLFRSPKATAMTRSGLSRMSWKPNTPQSVLALKSDRITYRRTRFRNIAANMA